jgi:hypothetical protein
MAMRNLKFLGLTLLTMSAIGAGAAPAALANQFHSTATNTTITVWSNFTQEFELEPVGHIVTCQGVGGSAEISAQTVAEVTFKPTYSGCTFTGVFFSTAQVSMGSCSYLFKINLFSNLGPVHIKCSKNESITITVKVFGTSVCTLHIAEQTPENVATYGNSGSTKVYVSPTLTGIDSTRQGSSECGPASSTTGSYNGEVQVKGEETGTQNEKAIQVG